MNVDYKVLSVNCCKWMDSRAAVLTGSDVGDVNKISSGLCRGKIAATVSPLQNHHYEYWTC